MSRITNAVSSFNALLKTKKTYIVLNMGLSASLGKQKYYTKTLAEFRKDQKTNENYELLRPLYINWLREKLDHPYKKRASNPVARNPKPKGTLIRKTFETEYGKLTFTAKPGEFFSKESTLDSILEKMGYCKDDVDSKQEEMPKTPRDDDNDEDNSSIVPLNIMQRIYDEEVNAQDQDQESFNEIAVELQEIEQQQQIVIPLAAEQNDDVEVDVEVNEVDVSLAVEQDVVVQVDGPLAAEQVIENIIELPHHEPEVQPIVNLPANLDEFLNNLPVVDESPEQDSELNAEDLVEIAEEKHEEIKVVEPELKPIPLPVSLPNSKPKPELYKDAEYLYTEAFKHTLRQTFDTEDQHLDIELSYIENLNFVKVEFICVPLNWGTKVPRMRKTKDGHRLIYGIPLDKKVKYEVTILNALNHTKSLFSKPYKDPNVKEWMKYLQDPYLQRGRVINKTLINDFDMDDLANGIFGILNPNIEADNT